MKKHAIETIILSLITLAIVFGMVNMLGVPLISDTLTDRVNSSNEIERVFSLFELFFFPVTIIIGLTLKFFVIIIAGAIICIIWTPFLIKLKKENKIIEETSINEQTIPITNNEIIKFDKEQFNDAWDKLHEPDNTNETKLNKLSIAFFLIGLLGGLFIIICIFWI